MDDYRDAIRYLYGLTRFGIKLGLDNTRHLAALAGDPQERLRFIHVAGTNGKGTTCSMLNTIYEIGMGKKVGLYISPHLISFRERMQVSRELITKDVTVRLVEELRALVEAEVDFKPTFFEFVTVMALKWFAERGCDLVILETGLGGRFDSTNIVTPLASVITPIGLDHQDILGSTLAEIAGEKAGIIKAGVPVICAKQQSSAAAVIERTARELRAPLTMATPCPELTDRLPGAYNRQNADLAIQVVRTLNEVIPVSDEQIASGLESYRSEWPGRLQQVKREEQQFILDGAHNADGFRALVAALAELLPHEKPALILGVLGDKDDDAIVETITGRFGMVITVPISSKRAGDVNALAAKLGGSTAADLAAALQATAEEPNVVIAGSFYLIGEALETLGVLPEGVESERELNEWGR